MSIDNNRRGVSVYEASRGDVKIGLYSLRRWRYRTEFPAASVLSLNNETGGKSLCAQNAADRTREEQLQTVGNNKYSVGCEGEKIETRAKRIDSVGFLKG